MNVKQKLLALAGLAGILPGIASAGGLYIYETANSGDIGYGSAGTAARAEDASTVFTNPAGMTRFEASNTVVGVSPLYIHSPFNADSATTVTGNGNGVKAFFSGANFGYVLPLNDKWSFGVSAQNYFGTVLNWGTQGETRFDSTQAVVVAPQIQPTLAYKINDAWSVGAGAALTLGVLEDRLMVDKLPFGDQVNDGRVKYSDTDFAVQGNFGVMYEPSEKTRIGLRYLTQTSLNWSDKPKFTDFRTPTSTATPVELDLGIKMPQSIMTSIWQRVNDRWAVLGSVGWDDWSAFKYVDVGVTGSGILPDPLDISTTINTKAKDTWHVGIGAEYQATDKLMYTMGFSWDSSMYSDNNRPIEIPLGTMYRLGGGAKYAKSDDLTLGGGLEVLYGGDLDVKPSTGNYGQVSGKYSSVYILFASFYGNWK